MKILKKNNKGFTLIEVVLVTGLIALFSIGIYGIYVKVSDSYTVTSEAREMNGILAAARSLIGGTNVTTLNATLLANARIIDSSRVIGLNYISGTGQQVSFEPIFVNTVSHIKVNYLKTTNIY
ncbi:MAG: prepilin-type N-terminal cleavage/methylation domain-containing protein, partial [Candidatus Sericytochromatia bacterium]|nr:prepilin-type N-terminal cleavage/methylation domain-containing protein [Candidatus Sericytochromatia bacterium]